MNQLLGCFLTVLSILYRQVEDGAWAHMVYAYVALQEGIIVEGESSITAAMKAALIRCACFFSLCNRLVMLG